MTKSILLILIVFAAIATTKNVLALAHESDNQHDHQLMSECEAKESDQNCFFKIEKVFGEAKSESIPFDHSEYLSEKVPTGHMLQDYKVCMFQNPDVEDSSRQISILQLNFADKDHLYVGTFEFSSNCQTGRF